MAKTLTDAQLSEYQREGVLFPLPIFSEFETDELRKKFERLEGQEGGKLSSRVNTKPHLLLKWLNELIRDPRILDPVEDILGPNILCWGSGFFVKNAQDEARVTWHQDSTYWGLSRPDIVTAWVAFTPSSVENGCMRVIPQTHTFKQLPHHDTFAKDNLLTRGQEIQVDVDERKAVNVVLGPGQMSLHHVRLIHGSDPNRSNHRRIGFAIRYLPTYIEQVSAVRDSATLVRGVDTYGHFLLEPAPLADFHPDAAAFHADMLDRNKKILYAGSQMK